MDLSNLSYEKAIKDQFKCLIFILALRSLSMLRFDSGFLPSWTRNPMPRSLVADSNLLQVREPRVFNLRGTENELLSTDRESRFPSDNHPTNIRSSHSQHADFVENVAIIGTASYQDFVARIATKIATKKASVENLPRAVQQGTIISP
ncbi:hypothetical protein ACTXT7_004588 [Hymenolepis weldensis]